MRRQRQRFRPTAFDCLEERVVMSQTGAGVSALSVPTTNPITIADLQLAITAIGHDYDVTESNYLQQALMAFAPGTGTPGLHAFTTAQLNSLATQINSQIAAISPIVAQVLSPVLSSQINGAAPGSLLQVLNTIPETVSGTGSVGTLQEYGSLTYSLDAFTTAKVNAINQLVSAYLTANVFFVTGGQTPTLSLSSLQQAQVLSIQATVGTMANYVAHEVNALTPGSPPGNPTLQQFAQQQLATLSNVVATIFNNTLPLSSASLTPLLQSEIAGTGPGALGQVLSTIPNSNPFTGTEASVTTYYDVELAINSFLATNLSIVNQSTVFYLENVSLKAYYGVSAAGASNSIMSQSVSPAQAADYVVVGLTPTSDPSHHSSS